MGAAAASDLEADFAAAMGRLGPFEPNPALAVAVSGGADSLALALLTHDWVRQQNGTVHALVVDHGLRPESAREAEQTIGRLAAKGIGATLLRLTTLHHGAALAERARIMRYQVMSEACRRIGVLHLLLGHHAADQAETLMMRALGDSGTSGLAGMPAVREIAGVRLLRPLLRIAPEDLRQYLRDHGVGWVEDPSNQDAHALRSRLRSRAAPHLTGEATADLLHAARTAGVARAGVERQAAAELADRAVIRPEGFAVLSPGPVGPAVLATLIRIIGGALYGAAAAQVFALAANPRPATLGRARLTPAGRLGDGFLVLREETAIGRPVPAITGAVWDRRFRVVVANGLPDEAVVGALGQDAVRFRRTSALPSAVLRTLPALRIGNFLAAVPHLGYADPADSGGLTIMFQPPAPAAGGEHAFP